MKSFACVDRQGRRLFVSDGISSGKAFGTFYRKPFGSLKRLVSKSLPMCSTRVEAEADLAAFAHRNGCTAVTEEEVG